MFTKNQNKHTPTIKGKTSPAPLHPRDAFLKQTKKSTINISSIQQGTQQPVQSTKSSLTKNLGNKIFLLAQHQKNCAYSKSSLKGKNGQIHHISLGSTVACEHNKLMFAYKSPVLDYICWKEVVAVIHPVRYLLNRNKLSQ